MSFELSVSADYVHAWKALLGKEMGDGMVGFCGTAASVLLIAENLIREVRAIK